MTRNSKPSNGAARCRDLRREIKRLHNIIINLNEDMENYKLLSQQYQNSLKEYTEATFTKRIKFLFTKSMN